MCMPMHSLLQLYMIYVDTCIIYVCIYRFVCMCIYIYIVYIYIYIHMYV